MAYDPVLVENTRAWLVRASDDLRGAEIDLAATPPLLKDALFHSQQAVEKALKAFLTWHDEPFSKTHNLTRLGKQCVAIEETLRSLLNRAASLSDYAWKFRYPGEPAEPTRAEAEECLALAREGVDAVLARLPAEVKP